MESIVDNARRVGRLQRECAGATGQARVLAWALAVLVVVLGVARLIA